jgi:predicted amidohydrolase YtcJ
VVVGGKIWTENPKQPTAEAIAVSGSQILAVGDTRTILGMAGPSTRVIDVQGRRVLPGFNDAHVHFYIGGDALTSVNLVSCPRNK